MNKKITIFAPSSVQKPVLHLVDFLVEGNRPIKYAFKIREISLLQWLWWKCGLWLLSYKYEKKKKLNKSLPKKKEGVYTLCHPTHLCIYTYTTDFFEGCFFQSLHSHPQLPAKILIQIFTSHYSPAEPYYVGREGSLYIYTHIYMYTDIMHA